VRRAFVPDLNHQRLLSRWISQGRLVATPELDAIKDHLRLPLSDGGDRILRYETAIERQLAYAINQLERMQRARKGEHVPAAGERSSISRSVEFCKGSAIGTLA
jgi:hypothetical protein